MKTLTPQILAMYLGCEVQLSDGRIGFLQKIDTSVPSLTLVGINVNGLIHHKLIQEIKPILRPLSSMSEEEKIEYLKLGMSTVLFDATYGKVEFGKVQVDEHNLTGESFEYKVEVTHRGRTHTRCGTAVLYHYNSKQLMFLLSKSFNLIPDGLAVEKKAN